MKQKVLTIIGVLILPLLGCAPDGGTANGDIDMHAHSLVSREMAVSIQSQHPYANDSREVFQVTAPQGAVTLTIHFDRLQVEEGYDYVLVYDGDAHLIRSITGHKDGESVLVGSPSAYIVMWSDGSVTDYGFEVTHISYSIVAPDPNPSDPVPADVGEPCEHRMPEGSECVEDAYCASDDTCHADGQCVIDSDCELLGNTWNHVMCTPGVAHCNEGVCAWECTSPDPQPSNPVWSWTRIMADGIESDHPYDNDYVHTWTIHRDGASKIRLHFSKIDMEEGYDYIVIRGSDTSETIQVDGYYEDVWSPEFTGDTVTIEIHTDYSVTKWGFEVDYAEYYEQLPQGHCNTDDDCSDGQACHQVMCTNPYEACYGECRAQ